LLLLQLMLLLMLEVVVQLVKRRLPHWKNRTDGSEDTTNSTDILSNAVAAAVAVRI
jgi:hypothetical protein